MHNPFIESPSQLRKDWKQLRTMLTADLTDQQHLDMVVKWWAMAPITRDWLNWDDTSTWPDPWELMATKNLDYSAIALGMEYTLFLGADGRWTPDRIHLRLASDTGKTMQHLVVIVDNKFILNFYHATVADTSDGLVTYAQYQYDGKNHFDLSNNISG